MRILRFLVTYAEKQNFKREVEIGDSHTFLDFHKIMQQCIGLGGRELASFFICNENWKKHIEITLLNMNKKTNERLPEETSVKKIKPDKPTYVMDEIKLGDLVNGNNKQLIYEYDFINPKKFYVELQGEAEPKNGKDYPRCISKRGSLPETIRYDSSQNLPDINEKELLDEFNKLLHHHPDEDENEF